MTQRPAFLSEAAVPKRETLFEQVSRSLSGWIRDGRWKPGEMLPNEVELAQAFGVSQGTMRRALRILVENGVLVREQGRGTFVAEFSRGQGRLYERFVTMEPDDPKEAERSPTEAELIVFERAVPAWRISEKLKIEAGTPVIHAVRLLKTSAGLVTYDELWCNPDDFRSLTAENLAHHEEKMLYAFYQRACGVTIVRKDETAKAVLMPEDLCAQFGLTPPLPVIEIRRVSYTYSDHPVEFRRQYSITGRYHFRIA